MSDLISRKWLMECVDEGWIKFDTEKDKNIYVHLVRDIAPSAQPEPRWIPCSERLPEEYGNYLITTYDGNVDIGTIEPNGKSVWSACDADGFYWMRNVIAWMPLPEPYKGGEKDG